MQRHGGMPQAWQAPIPAFPQRGKERKPEGKRFTSPASIPSPAGGGLGWGPARCSPHHSPVLKVVHGPHPCLPPEGEGEEARGERIHLSRLYSLPLWGRVRVGATRRGRSTPHPDPLPQAGEGTGVARRAEGFFLLLSVSSARFPSPFGGGLGWGPARCSPHHLPVLTAMPGPHPCLPPEGEGVNARGRSRKS